MEIPFSSGPETQTFDCLNNYHRIWGEKKGTDKSKSKEELNETWLGKRRGRKDEANFSGAM